MRCPRASTTTVVGGLLFSIDRSAVHVVWGCIGGSVTAVCALFDSRVVSCVCVLGPATNAELAWHFFLPSLTSGYMYYGEDASAGVVCVFILVSAMPMPHLMPLLPDTPRVVVVPLGCLEQVARWTCPSSRLWRATVRTRAARACVCALWDGILSVSRLPVADACW